MMRCSRFLIALLVALAFLAGPQLSVAGGQTKTTHVKGYTKKDGTKVKPHERKAPSKTTAKKGEKRESSAKQPVVAVARDSRGRFVRSSEAKRTFMRNSGYPKGRPGYVVDHIVPLACGGPDSPSNMQWQTAADAKAKDKIERRGC